LRLAEYLVEAFPAKGTMMVDQDVAEFVHGEPSIVEAPGIAPHVDAGTAFGTVEQGTSEALAVRNFRGDPESRQADAAGTQVSAASVTAALALALWLEFMGKGWVMERYSACSGFVGWVENLPMDYFGGALNQRLMTVGGMEFPRVVLPP
jgi:hypothetical protein